MYLYRLSDLVFLAFAAWWIIFCTPGSAYEIFYNVRLTRYPCQQNKHLKLLSATYQERQKNNPQKWFLKKKVLIFFLNIIILFVFFWSFCDKKYRNRFISSWVMIFLTKKARRTSKIDKLDDFIPEFQVPNDDYWNLKRFS